MRFKDRLSLVFNQNKFDDFIRKWMSGEDITDIKGDVIDVSGDNALKFSAVFACCRVLSETFATVPLHEYKKEKDGSRNKTNDTGLYDMLHNSFNSEMSAFMAKEMGMYQLNLGGNAVYIRGRNRLGETIELTPYHWSNVKIERNARTSRLEYIIKIGNGEEKIYNRQDVFHVAGPSLNGIVGMSPIEYAAKSIKLGAIYENFSTNFYKNGIISTGVFEHPGELKDDAYSRLKDQLRKEYTGFKNNGKPLLLEDGLKFTQLEMKLADAELLSSKKFQIEDVNRIYRVPLHLVQNLDKATNNNIEHQSLEFVMYTMLPWFKRWEDAINTQLLTKEQRDNGYYFEANMSTLLRGDQKSMAEAFAQGRQWGWLSVNDIRKLMNMNPIDNGNIYLQPLNMIEAGKDPVDNKILKDVTNLIKEGRNG